MSLVAVLVAAAVLGILAVALMGIYENMSNLLGKTIAYTDADKLMRTLQKIMDQQDNCKFALANPPNNWNGTAQVPITSINYCSAACAGPKIASNNMPVGSANSPIQVDQVILGPPFDPVTGTFSTAANPASNYFPLNPATNLNGPQHRGYNASIEVTFKLTNPNAPLAGGVLRPRFINAVVGVDIASGAMDDCPAAEVKTRTYTCAFADVKDPALTRCNTRQANGGGAARCPMKVFVSGFDTNGKPVCDCEVQCN
jgi:hypothetical protein